MLYNLTKFTKIAIIFIIIITHSQYGFSQKPEYLAGKNENISSQSNKTQYYHKPPKYIFYFIGDGMSFAQVEATEALMNETDIFNKHRHLKDRKSLAMKELPVTGIVSTRAGNRFITGSAAAGTALATGEKTSINTISKSSDRSNNLKTIAEIAKENGMKTGILSSVSIDHATPACFYAHENDRNSYYSISQQMATSNFDYFAGGYAKGDFNKNNPETIRGLMQQNGYFISSTRDELHKAKPEQKVWAFTEYTQSDAAFYYEIDRTYDSNLSGHITLAEFTKKGIELLQNESGFFIMVEGGKIDWACHANDAVSMAYEVVAFDEAIAVALDFYKKNAEETLIIVTADHECGGLSLGSSYTKYDNNFDILKYQRISHELFETKVDSWKNSESISFEMALDSIAFYFGLGNGQINKLLALNEWELTSLRKAYDYTMTGKSEYPKEYLKTIYSDNPLTVTITKILNLKAGIAWGSFSHTAVSVPLFAIGQGDYLFNGWLDNTDVPKYIMKIAGFERD